MIRLPPVRHALLAALVGAGFAGGGVATIYLAASVSTEIPPAQVSSFRRDLSGGGTVEVPDTDQDDGHPGGAPGLTGIQSSPDSTGRDRGEDGGTTSGHGTSSTGGHGRDDDGTGQVDFEDSGPPAVAPSTGPTTTTPDHDDDVMDDRHDDSPNSGPGSASSGSSTSSGAGSSGGGSPPTLPD